MAPAKATDRLVPLFDLPLKLVLTCPNHLLKLRSLITAVKASKPRFPILHPSCAILLELLRISIRILQQRNVSVTLHLSRKPLHS